MQYGIVGIVVIVILVIVVLQFLYAPIKLGRPAEEGEERVPKSSRQDKNEGAADKTKGRLKEAAGSLTGKGQEGRRARGPGQGHPQGEEGRRERPPEVATAQ
jgi:hypothetical protein